MLFQGRLDRARRLQRAQRGLSQEGDRAREPGEADVPGPERPAPREEMEKGDLFAMLLAGLLTVFLPAAGILALVVGLACLLFGIR